LDELLLVSLHVFRTDSFNLLATCKASLFRQLVRGDDSDERGALKVIYTGFVEGTYAGSE
jgi:hypothetical protein